MRATADDCRTQPSPSTPPAERTRTRARSPLLTSRSSSLAVPATARLSIDRACRPRGRARGPSPARPGRSRPRGRSAGAARRSRPGSAARTRAARCRPGASATTTCSAVASPALRTVISNVATRPKSTLRWSARLVTTRSGVASGGGGLGEGPGSGHRRHVGGEAVDEAAEHARALAREPDGHAALVEAAQPAAAVDRRAASSGRARRSPARSPGSRTCPSRSRRVRVAAGERDVAGARGDRALRPLAGGLADRGDHEPGRPAGAAGLSWRSRSPPAGTNVFSNRHDRAGVGADRHLGGGRPTPGAPRAPLDGVAVDGALPPAARPRRRRQLLADPVACRGRGRTTVGPPATITPCSVVVADA